MILKCELKNCYGIESFNQEFDFTTNKTFVIYASNGVMKTSFARTFAALQNGIKTKEEIHNKISTAIITINDVSISQEEIFVINPYIETYEFTNVSTLLVDECSKKEYETEINKILILKTSLLSKLNKISGIKVAELESLIMKDFDRDDNDDFFTFLLSQQNVDDANHFYIDVEYTSIFNDKVLALLNNPNLDLKDKLSEYSKIYNNILETVTFFGKNAFNPSRADEVLSTLKKNLFFSKANKIKLDGKDSLFSEDNLEIEFTKAKEALATNQELKIIQDTITKNVQVKSFQHLIENKPEIINDLNNLKDLKQKIWQSYFSKYKEDITNLLSSYEEKKEILASIEKKANLEKTKWHNVIKIFKQRFNVPFDLDIKDYKSAILGQIVPHIIFKFKDNNEQHKTLHSDDLNKGQTLSNGERKALYFLNMIFEVESRAGKNTRTIFIIDDIADSFDYRNKYAIIQYLKELPLKAENRFFQIILTHNFDFFRTIQERILQDTYKRAFSFIAQKSKQCSISLIKAGDRHVIRPFEYWKSQLKDKDNDIFIIAMIPFVRELLNYLKNKKATCDTLTSLLHLQDNTVNVTVATLIEIYNESLGLNLTIKQKDQKVFDIILSTANEISKNNSEESCFNLENKIILAIASRLQAERYIKFCGIDLDNKLGQSFHKFVDKYKLDDSKQNDIKVLEEVVIMTPENIHLNSFMYEPIIDMSDWHLKALYNNISILCEQIQG